MSIDEGYCGYCGLAFKPVPEGEEWSKRCPRCFPDEVIGDSVEDPPPSRIVDVTDGQQYPGADEHGIMQIAIPLAWTARDEFAKAAMTGVLSTDKDCSLDYKGIARYSYEQADAMMKEREVNHEDTNS